jgi:glycosyltransferase involved in cell wall biosynthesis
MTLNIAHLSSAHPRDDSRVFLKECLSLAAAGHNVSLIVADGFGDETRDGVTILDAGRSSVRLRRIFGASQRVFEKAVELNADIYHLHDPELLPAGLRLKRLGKTVIYDAHEDVAKQLLAKPYLGPKRLRLLSHVFAKFERFAVRRLDAVIAATPTIGDKFIQLNERTVVVNNYPLLDELYLDGSWDHKENTVCYVGGITETRGIREIIVAMSKVKSSSRLKLAGRFSDSRFETEVESLPGWDRTDALGFLDRNRLKALLRQSVAGLVTLHAMPNYVDSQPIKMFEYMSAGIPVIASDFPLWRQIIEDAQCGYCVDPSDTSAIAALIDELLADRNEARRLGENGRRAVVDRYNWPSEEAKLLEMYSALGPASSH